MSDIKITGVRAIETAPQKGCNLVVVRVDTNQPGLYGLGCATFTQRHKAVVTAVDEYMSQLLVGHDALDVEDAYQKVLNASYWRNGPVLNNALSGCDQAMWDILGKVANLPVYRLLGGKCRPAVPIYGHVDGTEPVEVEDGVRALMEKGYQYIRCQMGGYGGKKRYLHTPEGAEPGAYFDPKAYMRDVPRMFEHLRCTLGDQVELLHDVHERLMPVDAIRLAKELEPYRLFFLEDPLAPEQVGWFQQLRNASATPIAMGELFNNPNDWMPLVENRLIDYIRCHISQLGGITPARKLAALCESFGIKTAWHGPGDVSPVGHAANLHLDLAIPNFGIQEWAGMQAKPELREVFTGMPEYRNGHIYIEDRPGLGIDIDEEAAKRYPCDSTQADWILTRTPDGTCCRA